MSKKTFSCTFQLQCADFIVIFFEKVRTLIERIRQVLETDTGCWTPIVPKNNKYCLVQSPILKTKYVKFFTLEARVV